MNRFVRPATSMAALAVLVACSTLVGHTVTGTLEEIQIDGAMVATSPPAHCSPPHADATFALGDGVVMTITNRFGKGLHADFRIRVDSGRAFAFTSTTGRIDFPDGTSRDDVAIWHATWLPNQHTVWAPVAADTAVAGPAARGDRGEFSGDLGTGDVAASEFTVQLPDAVVNGAPYRFPPMRFKGHELSYFGDACLR